MIHLFKRCTNNSYTSFVLAHCVQIFQCDTNGRVLVIVYTGLSTIDLSSTFVLQVLNAYICKENERRNIIVAGLARVLIGFMFNVALFIAICVVNNAEDANMILITIYIIAMYSSATFAPFNLLFCDDNCKFSEKAPAKSLEEAKKAVRYSLVFYKCVEIPFDIMCLCYELSFNDYIVTTDFDIAITLITVLDIMANVIQLTGNCYISCKELHCCPP